MLGSSETCLGEHEYDVSIILNIHRESSYLRSTLRSLAACANVAAHQGIKVELVAVFDRSDQQTVDAFVTADLSAFASVANIKVDFGSLGLSRNAGLSMARGEFIWTADADDLVSSNSISTLLVVARAGANNRIAVFSEYYVGFGEKYYIARYERSALLTPADFAFSHPYVSRVFIKRSTFLEFPYKDLKVSKGFAFEDFDFNSRLIAAGYKFEIARDCVVYYRQRADSLVHLANLNSTRLAPPCELFEPSVFLNLMRQKKADYPNWENFKKVRRQLHSVDIVKAFFSSNVLRASLAEASEIDPEVDPARLKVSSSYCPVPWNQDHWGFALEDVFELVGQDAFSDVLLLPWLNPGGGEKYILQILDALRRRGGTSRILVISGQRTDVHGWRDRLPDDCTFLDIFNAFPLLNDDDRDELVVRSLLATGRHGARLHLKPSDFTHRLLNRFGAALHSRFRVIYYRFSDRSFAWNGHKLRDPWGIQFLRRTLDYLDIIISDCNSILKQDAEIIPTLAKKSNCVYSLCEIDGATHDPLPLPRYKLLWASRISSEKKPELVGPLARELSRILPRVTIDVFGNLSGSHDPATLFGGANIEYQGGFDSFSNLPLSRYDGLVYTSEYDGLPNVILEAMGSGLLVIAPSIGGIPEVVNAATGYLVGQDEDSATLLRSYVNRIQEMYGDWPSAMRKREAAAALVHQRHGLDHFLDRVADVFDVHSSADAVRACRHIKNEHGDYALVSGFVIGGAYVDSTERPDAGTDHQTSSSDADTGLLSAEAMRNEIARLNSLIRARDERITELGTLVKLTHKSSPSAFKTFLIRLWDSLPKSAQRAIEPIADVIDRTVK